MNRNRLISVAGFVVSIVLLYLSVRGTHFGQIGSILKAVDFRLLPVSVMFIFTSASLCAYRWAKVSGRGTKFSETFTALIIGLFVNNVLPARIGEAARGYVLAKRRGYSFTFALSTVLLDRFFDLTGLIILLFIFFPRQSLPPAVSKAIYAVLALLLTAIALIFLFSGQRFTGKLTQRLLKTDRPFLSGIAHKIAEIAENLRRIKSPSNLLICVVLSCMIWFSMSLALYTTGLALHVDLPFFCVPFVCALLNMGLTIPSSPGYIGVYQFLLVYLLSIFDVPKEQGFAISVLYHASWYVPYNLLGFFLLLREHVHLRDIKKLGGRGA